MGIDIASEGNLHQEMIQVKKGAIIAGLLRHIIWRNRCLQTVK